jgi:hypothetical protein
VYLFFLYLRKHQLYSTADKAEGDFGVRILPFMLKTTSSRPAAFSASTLVYDKIKWRVIDFTLFDEAISAMEDRDLELEVVRFNVSPGIRWLD